MARGRDRPDSSDSIIPASCFRTPTSVGARFDDRDPTAKNCFNPNLLGTGNFSCCGYLSRPVDCYLYRVIPRSENGRPHDCSSSKSDWSTGKSGNSLERPGVWRLQAHLRSVRGAHSRHHEWKCPNRGGRNGAAKPVGRGRYRSIRVGDADRHRFLGHRGWCRKSERYTTPTDSSGTASVTYTAGPMAGAATITAAVAGIGTAFSETIT